MADTPLDRSSNKADSLAFRQRLHAALKRIVQPVAAYARFALGIVAEEEPAIWLCNHKECLCTDGPVDLSKAPDGLKSTEVLHRNLLSAHVVLCTRGGELSLFTIAQNLITEAIHQVELEFEDDDLIREVGSSWESLHTLYEISSDLRTSRNIPDILARILDRMVAGRPNLHAILWIEKEGRFEPTIARGAEAFAARDAHSGILGRTAIGCMPVVINDPAKIRIDPDLEPELAKAEKIAIVPIASRDRLVGVLEIWQEPGAGEFDSPMIRLFEALALQAAMVLESERAYRMSVAEERLRREIEIGGKIQETLLLGQPPATLPGIRIGVLTVPSRAVDGDFFDFLSCGDDCLDVFVGDVMGKGIPAALVGAAAKSDLLKAFGELTAINIARQVPAPKDIVTHVHQHLTGRLIDIESFISLFYSRFDLSNRQMDFVDCGHPRAIHYHTDQGKLEMLAGDNLPLGIIEGGSYTQATVSFNPGDVFLFYSDGVTDAYNATGEHFGEERLKSIILSHAGLEPAEICAKIRESVAAFSGTQTVTDDLTCLSVKIGSIEECTPSMRWSVEFLSYLEFLPTLRGWIRGVCLCVSPNDPNLVESFELAVTEAVSNVIRHAYQGHTGKKIIIEAQSFADRMAITISHWGKHFRPETDKPKAPDAMLGHGYGLFIISKVVDKVTYFEGPYGADCVRLEKLLRKTAGGEICMMATIEKSGEVTIVEIAIESLNSGNEKRFKKEVIPILLPNSKVVLDMSEVDFIDSSGLGVILSCYRHINAAGGDMRLCCLNEQVRTLFELVRIHRVFDIYNTREEALGSFTQLTSPEAPPQ
jgi:anti-anti-sigma factor